MPVASIVAFIFLPEIPGTTERQEQFDIRQQPHEHVERDDATDSDTDEFGNLILLLSINA